MYDLECKAEEIPEFRDIAFFHHIILRQITAVKAISILKIPRSSYYKLVKKYEKESL